MERPHGHLDRFQVWLIDERNAEDPSLAFAAFDGFATFVDNLVGWLDQLLRWLTWVGTAVTGTLLALRFGGWRAAIWVVAAFATFALTGLWAESMQTLALMVAAVGLSLLVGIPLGIVAGLSNRFRRAITPVLDAMQIVPAFGYLIPVAVLFSVGPGAAVVSTMIYAIPPAIRITALGIRGVQVNTVEAATSMGAHARSGAVQGAASALAEDDPARRQPDDHVRPLDGRHRGPDRRRRARRRRHQRAVTRIRRSRSSAGIAIVVMAMALDRSTEAVADRTDPARRHLSDRQRRALRLATLAGAAGIGLTVVLAKAFGAAAIYPSTATAQEWLLGHVQSVLDYVQDTTTFVFSITQPLGEFIVVHLLQPPMQFLLEAPWFTTLAGVTAIAFVISGLRPAVTTFAMFAAIGVIGMWQPAMETFAQVLVATGITVVIGIALGVAAAESGAVSRIMRPVNDVFQTLPQLVYIIPFVYLTPISYVPGILASVLFAFPAVVRLVERGVQGRRTGVGRGGARVRCEPQPAAASRSRSRSPAMRSCSA